MYELYYYVHMYVLYRKQESLACRKLGEIGESSVIHQIKGVVTNNNQIWLIYSFAKLFFVKHLKRVNLPNILLSRYMVCPYIHTYVHVRNMS